VAFAEKRRAKPIEVGDLAGNKFIFVSETAGRRFNDVTAVAATQ